MHVEFEHMIETIPITEELSSKVQSLAKEGWQLMPNVPPVAIYHLVRAKSVKDVEAMPALGKLNIDDSKIFVIPGKREGN